MKRPNLLTFAVITVLLAFYSCKPKQPETPVSTAIDVNLTAEEKAGGVLTPEILWKYGRIGTITLSPDGATVLYTVTNYDLPTEARTTNIFSITVIGRHTCSTHNRRRIRTSVDQRGRTDCLHRRWKDYDNES